MFRLLASPVRRVLGLALLALVACADEPTATVSPRTPGAPRPAALAGDVVTVINASGGPGGGSLRWALHVAPTGAIIRFDPSLDGATIALDSTLSVERPVTIEGPRGRGITLSGGDSIRVMHVHASATLRNLTITRGYHPFHAGAIWSDAGTVTLEHSTVSHNASPGVGAIRAAQVNLLNSTVANNSGGETASGVAYSAEHGGASIVHSTIARNSAAPGLGAYDPYFYGNLHIQNSILAGNGYPRANCGYIGAHALAGLNVVDDVSCGQVGRYHLLVADPRLGTLANHGGPTPTLDLARESPALNAGAECDVALDQRYAARDARCDPGAFEFALTTVALTIDPSAAVDAATGAAVVTGTVRCSRAEPQLWVRAQLRQEKGGKTPTVAMGYATVPVACTTSAQPWRVTVTPKSGTFESGSAAATATTPNAPQWVLPASSSAAVKLTRAPK